MSLVSENFSNVVAARLRQEHTSVAARWLDRLAGLLPVDAADVFPSDHLLDHIPDIVVAIADYLDQPEREAIAANGVVVVKARELGALRHAQGASLHQIVREYRIFEGVLSSFVKEVLAGLGAAPAVPMLVDLLGHVHQAVSVLQQATLESFIEQYADMVAQQQSKLEAFNRMVSHELRQPLGALQVAVRLLQMPSANASEEERRRLLSVLERNVLKTQQLTEQLTRLSGLSAPADQLQVQHVALAAVAREVGRQLRDMAEAKQVAVQVAEDELPEASVDIGAVELILVNLVSNGIKYSDPAKPERFVRIGLAPAAQDECGLEVRDNGLGIPPSRLETIFRQHVRAHASRDAELHNDGLGLGLAIVQDCLRSIGGRIEVESVEGEGTVFRVLFPCTRGAAG